jgi:uncharacterized RDD family membrane protein YckC
MNPASTTAAPLLDTALAVDTPEGCRIALRIAGPVSRARAWLLDFAIRFGVYVVSAQVLGFFGGIGFGIMLVLIFALEWLYPTIFEVLWQGATPGKRACRLAVLRDDGTPIDWGAAFIRNLLRVVDFFPVFYGIGLVAMFVSTDCKRIGDLAAGTVVVYTDEPALPKIAEGGASEPPPIPLTVSEQRAVIGYALREQRLTPERAEELAMLATPLTGGLAPAAARSRVVAIGRFLMGQR